VVFYGGFAKKGARIDRNKHLVLESGHPSPLAPIKGIGLATGISLKPMTIWIAKGKKSN
jgi:uracil-DNA glycosylase